MTLINEKIENIKKIKFTKFNTVLCDDFDEMTISDFFRIIETNLDTKDYSVIYDNEKNTFTIIYKGNFYQVEIDKNIMEQYRLGIYTPLTRKLRKLNMVEKLIESPSLNDIKNDEERLVYLEYLKNSKKFSANKISKYFTNLGKDLNFFFKYLIRYFRDSDGYSLFVILFLACFWICGLAALCLLFPAYALENFSLLKHALWPFCALLVYPIVDVLAYLATRLGRLLDCFSNHKLVNEKIKSLEHPLSLTHNKSLNLQDIEKIIDNKVNDSEQFQNILLKEINTLVERLSFINQEDRVIIGKEIKDILNEYKERMSTISNNSNNNLDIFNLDKDGLEKLKIELLAKISEVEEKISSATKKNLANSQRLKETELIEGKLNRAINGLTAYSAFINDSPNSSEFVIPGEEEKESCPRGCRRCGCSRGC